MNTRAESKYRRFKPPATEVQSEVGYDAWLAAEIEAGCAELDAGQAIPAEKAWKDLGLE